MATDGICEIKKEYVVIPHVRELDLECVSNKDINKLQTTEDGNEADSCKNEPAEKKPKLSKAEKKKLRGINKSRPATFKRNKKTELCNSLMSATSNKHPTCDKKQCEFMHNVNEYLQLKPSDIGSECYNFNTTGRCHCGLSCRYGKNHITDDGWNIVDEEKVKIYAAKGPQTLNSFPRDLQYLLRKRTFDFHVAEAVVKYSDGQKKKNNTNGQTEISENETIDDIPITENKPTFGTITDEDVIKILQREKKKIDWNDKLFLSPLTTVGNLPFRRICKEFGVDVTCGEMAMCSSLLQGMMQEWALVKRHSSEDIFGIQLCANNPYLFAKCGQMLEQEMNIDFIDINLGCPIELVYRQGGGSGLLRRPHVLESCIRSMSNILSIPLTLKTRIGVYTDDNIAHKLIPNFRDWGASLVTIHGRSREQRYTKSADWDYIRQCAQLSAPMPVLGNGDILSYEDYKIAREKCPELTGVMIGRGALIKPWIFTEIKEEKLWDISSGERFDIIKKYVNYGLEHWGSDNKGVENTRRFLLEWLSFLHRYIPVGLLEKPPQKINERPPLYQGRNDMETLMASASASDWIKITEMLLGPVPEGFKFLPKHKANSYK